MSFTQQKRGSALERGSWVTDWGLFLCSYVPAFVALAIRFQCPTWLRPACAACALAGIGIAAYFIFVTRLLTRDHITLTSVEDKAGDVGGYLATYLLPIVVISTPSVPDIIAYVVVFLAIGLVFVRSRLIYVNPTFALLGYGLFWVATQEGFRGYMLVRGIPPRAGDSLWVVQRERIIVVLERDEDKA